MDTASARAGEHLRSAAALDAHQDAGELVVRVTNLTGHKLISGYPEGRRMWLNLGWYDAGGGLLLEQGAYGPIGRSVQDLSGVSHEVASLLDPADTVVYEAQPGLDQAWAAALTSLGYDPALALSYDRLTDAAEHTLGELATSPAGTAFHSFHFVLNDVVVSDNRIPPYGLSYDLARERSILPVPENQYGDPGPGGRYHHWSEPSFPIPADATRVEVRLMYQSTSWEYVQFLWLANDGLDPFLGNEGVNLLDAWLNTGMSPPVEMALVSADITQLALAPGEAGSRLVGVEPMRVAKDVGSGELVVGFGPACDATDHAIFFGSLAAQAGYVYADAACGLGITGSARFDPGAGELFFYVVANNGSVEGSYGQGAGGMERPEAVGVGACDLPQDLTGPCDD
jgi:hypothetical protein